MSYKPFEIKFPTSMLFIGSSNTGKSYLLKSLLVKYIHNFNYGLVISPTDEFNEEYDYIDSRYVHNKYSLGLIMRLINKQREYKELCKKNKKMKMPECFLILDDCLGEINMRAPNNIIDILFSKGRHYHITVMVTIQKITYISPTVRENAKYVFITKVAKSSYEHIFDLSDDFANVKDLTVFLDRNCVDYRVVVFDHTDPYAKSHVRIIKAPQNIPNIKISF